jgi:DNA-binding LytR/AlgR family response regulator
MRHALLIDDEPAARADLREKLSAHADIAIVGEAATIPEARALLATADYDLVFLDVQLIGGESFQLLPEVRRDASIVFATAHDRHAARAFANRAVDYLLKPIAPERLAEALRRAAAPAPAVAPAIAPAAEAAAEIPLTADEGVFLRLCLEAWEDSLPPEHFLRTHGMETAGRRRAVRYERSSGSARLWVAANVPLPVRWWRSLRARLSR